MGVGPLLAARPKLATIDLLTISAMVYYVKTNRKIVNPRKSSISGKTKISAQDGGFSAAVPVL